MDLQVAVVDVGLNPNAMRCASESEVEVVTRKSISATAKPSEVAELFHRKERRFVSKSETVNSKSARSIKTSTVMVGLQAWRETP